MESQPQNPEFRINPENFHPCITSFYSYFDMQVPLTYKMDNSILIVSICRPLVKSMYQKNNFLNSRPKHMLWYSKEPSQ